MSDVPHEPVETPPANRSAAESRGQADNTPSTGPAPAPSGVGTRFEIGHSIQRAPQVKPYERQPGDPLYRPLRIFTLDPSTDQLEGSHAILNVPYEPLKPGPIGHLIQVV